MIRPNIKAIRKVDKVISWKEDAVICRLMSDGCYHETDHGIKSHTVQLGEGCRGYMLIRVGSTEKFVAPIYNTLEPIRPLYLEDHRVYCNEKPIPGSCEVNANYDNIIRYNSMHYENNEHKLAVMRITYVRMFNTSGLVESEIKFTNER